MQVEREGGHLTDRRHCRLLDSFTGPVVSALMGSSQIVTTVKSRKRSQSRNRPSAGSLPISSHVAVMRGTGPALRAVMRRRHGSDGAVRYNSAHDRGGAAA